MELRNLHRSMER